MSIILFLIGLILSADGLYCGATGSLGTGEAIVVGAGVMFMLWGSLHTAFKEIKFFRVIKTIFIILFSIITVYSVCISVIGHMDNATGSEDYVVVPGGALYGSDLSPTLKSRLDRTIEYLSSNTDAKVLVSGGKGEGEDMDESMAMYNYLVENDIDDKRIYMESDATSTYENFSLSREAIKDGTVAIITSDYHVIRASLMASLNDVKATHIGANTPIEYIAPNCAREFFAQIASVRHYI